MVDSQTKLRYYIKLGCRLMNYAGRLTNVVGGQVFVCVGSPSFQGSRTTYSSAVVTQGKALIRGTSRCLSSLLNKRRAPIVSLGSCQIHVIAVLRCANYHQVLGTLNRSIHSPQCGDCTADLDVTVGRMNVLLGNSRQLITCSTTARSAHAARKCRSCGGQHGCDMGHPDQRGACDRTALARRAGGVKT
jgi:hypothetical protein